MTVDAHPQTDPAVSVSAAEALVRQLERYGVEYVFGTCGHTNIALLDALGRSTIEFVIARHEQAAAHAADGYARASGRPGVLLVHVGPGMMNAVTGVATAALDSVPLVAIAGDVPSYYRGRHPHQEVNLHNDADQTAIYRPFVKRAWHVHRAEDLGRFTERAFWTATSGRPGAVLLNVPMDLFSRPVAPGSAPERCPTTPMTRRALAGAAMTSMPSTAAVPASGVASVVRILTVVVLPAPLGPTRAEMVPCGTLSVRPFRALTRVFPGAG